MRMRVLVGRCEIALLNGEKIVPPGNLKPGTFAGLSMGPFVRGAFKEAGKRSRRSVANVKCFERCYPTLFRIESSFSIYAHHPITYFLASTLSQGAE